MPVLVAEMGSSYPELAAQQTLIEKVIKEEEDAFLRTLDNGIKLLDSLMAKAKAADENEISGKDAFTLYDTFGFPLDLTELILRENGMTLRQDEFDAEMKKQKERARHAAAVETGDWTVVNDGDQQFVGYDLTETPVRILRWRKVKQKGKEYYQLILDKTPFYAEMGGQVGDKGVLIAPDGETVEIFDTKRENNIGVHLTHKLPSDPSAEFTARIDLESRRATTTQPPTCSTRR